MSEVLKGAIDGILPEKIDMKSLATERLYDFYNSPTEWTKGMSFATCSNWQLIYHKVHTGSPPLTQFLGLGKTRVNRNRSYESY